MSHHVRAHTPSTPAALYVRVSTDKQTDRFGLDLQLHACRQHAARQGYEVVRVYTEGDGVRGVSGAITSRQQTSAILSDLQQHPGLFRILILYDTSRLARDDSGVFGRWYEEELRKRGVSVEYVLGGYGEDPEGQLLKRIKQDFDTYERQKIAVRDRAGQAARARRGLWPGGYAPLGFDVVEGRLVINGAEAEIVRHIFHLYADQGLTIERIGERLHQQQVRGKWARKGTRHHLRHVSAWDWSGVYRLLTNPAYLGRAVWGRKKNPRPWIPHEEVEIPCPRIISDALWEKTQQRLAANRLHGRRDKRYPYLVSGLIRCQLCGRCLVTQTTKQAQLSYYFCVRKPHRWMTACLSRVRYRVAEVDAAVWAVIVQGLCSPAALEEKVACYLQTETLPEALEEARLRRVQEEVAAVERQADEVLRLGAASALAQARAQHLLQELDARHATLVQEREELEQRLRPRGQQGQSWQETLSHYRRWLLSTTWTEAGVGPLPDLEEAELAELDALEPPERLRPLLFALQQRIVRDLVEVVVLGPDGAGFVRLRGAPTGIPLQVTPLPPQRRGRKEELCTRLEPEDTEEEERCGEQGL